MFCLSLPPPPPPPPELRPSPTGLGPVPTRLGFSPRWMLASSPRLVSSSTHCSMIVCNSYKNRMFSVNLVVILSRFSVIPTEIDKSTISAWYFFVSTSGQNSGISSVALRALSRTTYNDRQQNIKICRLSMTHIRRVSHTYLPAFEANHRYIDLNMLAY